MEFAWTIIDGQLFVACLQLQLQWLHPQILLCPKALDGFISAHPGGSLIQRAVGRDASSLFHGHHTSDLARAVLAKCLVGYVKPYPVEAGDRSHVFGCFRSGWLGHVGSLIDFSEAQRLRAELNKRIGRYMKPETPAAEARHANRFSKIH